MGAGSWGSAEAFSLQQGWITQKVKANGWRCSGCEGGRVWRGSRFTLHRHADDKRSEC